MDTRLDLAERLIELTGDPDLWTRLQALESLRQWFYRTSDPGFAAADRRHLPRPDGRARRPVVRKNLSEGLYIMLDENLGGGVSLQKNIAAAARGDAAGDPRGTTRVRAGRAA